MEVMRIANAKSRWKKVKKGENNIPGLAISWPIYSPSKSA